MLSYGRETDARVCLIATISDALMTSFLCQYDARTEHYRCLAIEIEIIYIYKQYVTFCLSACLPVSPPFNLIGIQLQEISKIKNHVMARLQKTWHVVEILV